MPKISPIKGHNDSSFQIQNIPRRTFSQFNDQPSLPIIRTNNKQFHDSVVPIHEVSYNPQFSKSPLASVEISRRTPINNYQPQLELQPQYETHLSPMNHSIQNEKSDWKTILCWAGVIFGVIAFIIGLYFIVDAILSPNTLNYENEPVSNNNQQSGGMTPIYVSPIPYDSMSRASSTRDNISTEIHPVQSGGTTYPSALPDSQSPTNPSDLTKQPASSRPLTYPENSNSNLIDKKPMQYSIDPLENSIQPLNVYQNPPV